jgi:hypothetical protein
LTLRVHGRSTDRQPDRHICAVARRHGLATETELDGEMIRPRIVGLSSALLCSLLSIAGFAHGGGFSTVIFVLGAAGLLAWSAWVE